MPDRTNLYKKLLNLFCYSYLALLNNDSLWDGEVAENILNKVYNERLSEDERKLLQYVSIFRQPVSAKAISAIANDPEWSESKVKRVALRLTRKSLLQRDKENYFEESLISKYASTRLSEKSEHHKFACKYFLSLPLPINPSKIENLQPAIEAHYHACEAGEYDQAVNILIEWDFPNLLHLWGNSRTLIEIYKKMLPKDHFKGEPILKDKEVHEKVLGNLGNMYRNLNEPKKAIEYNEQALIIAREIGDRLNEGTWLGNIGLAYYSLGELKKAIEYYDQALKISREIGDRCSRGTWLANMGLIYSDMGEPKKAIDFLKKALAIRKSIEDQRIINFCEQKLKELEGFSE